MGAEGVIVAIDPAARGFAWARYAEGVLVACGNATVRDLATLLPDVAARWMIETPQNYDTFGAAHKDLDRLRATVASIEAHAKRSRGKVSFTKPFSWKGNLPKPIHHRRIYAVLTDEERAMLAPVESAGYDHNVYDAVALGLWAAGRVGRGGSRIGPRG